ncbi:MAG: phosphate ABC transporter permease subunit PstC [Opitutae bacterium]|nr:phosphate ABC transporter permease subunit PstC [Opitutae bacterium]
MSTEDLQPKDTSPEFSKRRVVLFGKDTDSIIKGFFGCTATVAIVVLFLITLFLIKEGSGFVGQYQTSLKQYRLSGLEYVDILKERREDHTALMQYLSDIKAEWINLLKKEGLTQQAIFKKVMSPESKAVFLGYSRTSSDLRRFIKDKMDAAIEIRDQQITNDNLQETLNNYAKKITEVEDYSFKLSEEDRAEFILKLKEKVRAQSFDADKLETSKGLIEGLKSGVALDTKSREIYLSLLRDEFLATENRIQPVIFEKSILKVTNEQQRYFEILNTLEADMKAILLKSDSIELDNNNLESRMERFKELNALFFTSIPEHKTQIKEWDQNAAVPLSKSLSSFLTGKDWITASDQQDWYGILPLLCGSLIISFVALCIAVPLGVGAAIYTNQISSPLEQNLIKPYIEFISAVPSVVIGFFGVVVLGEAMRGLSQLEFLAWVPFFPIQERLNTLTAGCLLALMAIPTIYTLAEDAINNIPKHLKEASLAIGATPLQTTFRVIVPSALSGIISAIMLGFGRVIGETMVVLLCAGNRIKIPEFSDGLGVFFQPVHTMTGIIAQEMGEVVRGSVHYRALFMVGIVLFIASLIINVSAQYVVKKYNKMDS